MPDATNLFNKRVVFELLNLTQLTWNWSEIDTVRLKVYVMQILILRVNDSLTRYTYGHYLFNKKVVFELLNITWLTENWLVNNTIKN